MVSGTISLNRMEKHKFFQILPFLFIFITIGNFLFHTYNYRQDIFAKFDARYWENRYLESQWVVPVSKNPVGDDGLYAYVGYAYMQGKDPTLLNAQLPPFGKYLVGLFEITTGTMGAFSLFFTGLSLVLFFLFTKISFKSNLLASVTTLAFSFEPLVIEQMRAPYLDTLYLSLFLLSSIFFVRKNYLLCGISTGLFMSVKSPFLGGLVLLVYALCLYMTKQKYIKHIFTIGLATAFAYMCTYARIFFIGHNLIYFLQVQKYILHFYTIGAKGVIGAIFPMILQGKWPTWFGPTLYVTEWTWIWPLSFIATIGALIFWVKTRDSTTSIVFHFVWLIGYMLFLIFTPIFPRYLLLLLPFLYNLTIWVFLKSMQKKYPWVLPS